MKSIFVLGSLNLDLVIHVDRIPLVGESKNGYGFIKNQGGKGANQAIACKKLGCENTYLIASIGDDEEGKYLKKQVDHYGVNTTGMIVTSEANSGLCMILVDDSIQDNILIVNRGANDKIPKDHVSHFLRKHANAGDIFISQLEVNESAIHEGLKTAKELGMYTILNPAPVMLFNMEYYKYVDLIIPNETECTLITQINMDSEENISKAFKWFNGMGVKEMVITLGSRGSYYLNNQERKHFDIRKVETVDTTGAGDTFIGALAFRLANNYTIKDSMDYAAICSSITVSRQGAGKSIPTKEEVNYVINKLNLK